MPKKILLADDSITIQKVVELTFSDGDYEVTAVNNGAKAVQKLAEMRPDIILSDIIMPEKNGYEVCEYVKSHPDYRNIPVVLLTGTFEPFDPDRAEKAGCDAVVTKPFESQSLIHKVEELIANAQSSAAAAPDAAPADTAASAPWMDEPAAPAAPMEADSPFAHGSDIFSETTPQAPRATEMPFDAPAPFGGDNSFGGDAAFGGETRAFPKMSFDDFAAPAAPQPPAAPVAPERSPWDEAPAAGGDAFGGADSAFAGDNAFGGETRAFPKMSFDEMQAMAAGSAPSPAAAPETESPFGAPPADAFGADDAAFSGATQAFPKLSYDDLQSMQHPAPPAAPPAAATEPPIAATPEPSPWDEAPAFGNSNDDAFGGETRAFPRMSFADLQAAAPTPEPEAPIATTPEPSPWDDAPAASNDNAFAGGDNAFGGNDDNAFGGETRAFPKMSFEDLQQAAAPTPEPEAPAAFGASEPAPWDEPASPAWNDTPAAPAWNDAPAAPAWNDAPAAPAWNEASAAPAWDDAPATNSSNFDAPPSQDFSTSVVPPFSPEPEPAFDREAEQQQEPEQEATPFAATASTETPFAETVEPEPQQRVEEVPPPSVDPAWSPLESPKPTLEELPVPAAASATSAVTSAVTSEGPTIPVRGDLTDEQIDRIARRVVEMLSDQVIRNIAWEVIPDMAEMVVKERIRQLEAE